MQLFTSVTMATKISNNIHAGLTQDIHKVAQKTIIHYNYFY